MGKPKQALNDSVLVGMNAVMKSVCIVPENTAADELWGVCKRNSLLGIT